MKFFLLFLATLPSAFATDSLEPRRIPMQFAFRDDGTRDDDRKVIFQGGDTSLENFCGPAASKCTCKFFRNDGDKNPMFTHNLGFSRRNNNISCQIPGITDPDDVRFVRLEQRDNSRVASEKLEVRTTLSLKDVIGSLDQSFVRGVYRYGCTRTFFEGEGASSHSLDCPAGQRLGLITAKYSFYLYNSQRGGNMSEKGGDTAYENPLCERSFLKLTCSDNYPDLRWGLYAQRTGPFQVGITMTANPEGENAVQAYGFAALPDETGNCPTGLVKIRPWEAQPQSIIAGSIDGKNPPSSFMNQNNNLNDRTVEEHQPMSFTVLRRENKVRCAEANSADPAPGSCRNAEFETPKEVQNVPYFALSPVVCAIPKHLMSGLF
jgi:hypothetical protein